ncbi:hypothetical protein GGR51DRAFT_511313 [Nemania sp. FL0031]|nr:hypothetical protein GGR51DRAFT_511313 [Nemania sp. FL0031]
MMLKHASDAAGAPKDRQRPAGRHSSRTGTAPNGHEPRGGSRSRAAARDLSDYANPVPPRARAGRPARSRSPSFAFRQGPPPPPPGPPVQLQPSSDSSLPPGLRGIGVPPAPHIYRAGGPPPPRPQHAMNQPMPPPQPYACFRVPGHPVEGPPLPIGQAVNRPPKPPAPNAHDSSNRGSNGNGSNLSRPFSVIYPTMQVYAVRMTVHWLRHGQHRIIAQCQPTRESLQSAAITDVRLNPSAFTSDMKGSPNSASSRDGSRLNLRAQVRRAVFGGEPYDLRTFHGQDLTHLFRAMASEANMPSFEVVVEDVPRSTDEDDDDDDDDNDDETSIRGSPSMTKVERWD